jgi:hypothetical protein
LFVVFFSYVLDERFFARLVTLVAMWWYATGRIV